MEDPPAHLRSLLRVSTLLQSAREMYASRGTPIGAIFEQHLLALISDLVPNTSGAFYLLEDKHSERPEFVERALEVKAPEFTEHELAIPLFVRDNIAGVIYLRRDSGFEEADCQLMTAISQITSLAIENAFHLEWLQGEVRRLERDLNIEHSLLGDSAQMAELRGRIARAAPSDTTVLILGESGTGKELVARAIHHHSPRSQKPFIAINCAALSETLLESELFGHEKGAFTGAIAQKPGKLEMARGGTVFLDEVGEVPLQVQAKLLRVLQHREVERVGGTRSIALDFRLIAATNRNLDEAVRRHLFRQDLFYRLNVVTLRTPCLRNRPEDILPLAHHFIARYGEKCGRKVGGISPQARALLRCYQWPGNVRELENAIEHAVVLGSSEMILPEDLPEALLEIREAQEDPCGSLREAVNAAKRMAVERAFQQSGNEHDEAARLLGVHPNYLYRLMKNMMLQPARKSAES